jgi:hypothetical protein
MKTTIEDMKNIVSLINKELEGVNTLDGFTSEIDEELFNGVIKRTYYLRLTVIASNFLEKKLHES